MNFLTFVLHTIKKKSIISSDDKRSDYKCFKVQERALQEARLNRILALKIFMLFVKPTYRTIKTIEERSGDFSIW